MDECVVAEAISSPPFAYRANLAGAIMSYGDLIWTTLTRARTAREAISVMDFLCTSYGYESEGESFGVGDPTEVSYVAASVVVADVAVAPAAPAAPVSPASPAVVAQLLCVCA